MKHFLDMGAHKLEGLKEFTEKLGIDKEWKVYSYEPNILIQEDAKKVVKEISGNYKSLEFFNKAVMDEKEQLPSTVIRVLGRMKKEVNILMGIQQDLTH